MTRRTCRPTAPQSIGPGADRLRRARSHLSWSTTHLMAAAAHLAGTEHAETMEELRQALLRLHERLAEEAE